MKYSFAKEGIFMKKFLLALFGLVFAVPFASADNIKMVTYFPVPYASYGDLSVSGTCDVGLLNSCSLDAGEKLNVYQKSSDSRALNTGSLIAKSGTLGLYSTGLHSQLTTSSLASHTSGSQTTTTGVLEFAHDLTVGSIKGNMIQSAQATNRAEMSDLYLFGSSFQFPACDASGHKMSWQNLTINGNSGVFLVCGTGTDAGPDKNCPSGKKWSDSSNKCVCSMILRCLNGTVWNSETCKCESSSSTPECPSGKTWSESDNACVCSARKLCLNDTTWDEETCSCVEKVEQAKFGFWSCTPNSCQGGNIPTGVCTIGVAGKYYNGTYIDSTRTCAAYCTCTSKMGGVGTEVVVP